MLTCLPRALGLETEEAERRSSSECFRSFMCHWYFTAKANLMAVPDFKET